MAAAVVNELRPCGNPRCRLCNPRPEPVRREGEEPLASLLLGAAAIVVAVAFVLFLLPVLAS
jgi:hypothetical protein